MKSIRITITTKDGEDYRNDREIYSQLIPIDSMYDSNPQMVEKIIAVVNNLPFPITLYPMKND